MPSRAYTSFLHPDIQFGFVEAYKAVSMPSRAYTSFLLEENSESHYPIFRVNALSGLYLISTLSENFLQL